MDREGRDHRTVPPKAATHAHGGTKTWTHLKVKKTNNKTKHSVKVVCLLCTGGEVIGLLCCLYNKTVDMLVVRQWESDKDGCRERGATFTKIYKDIQYSTVGIMCENICFN